MSSKLAKSVDAKLASLDYDPVIDIYKDRARRLAAKSKGVERLAYEIFGPELMGSLAYAIDPGHKFKFKNKRICPANRYRFIPGIKHSKRTGYRRNNHHQCVATHSYSTFYDYLNSSDCTDFLAADYTVDLTDQLPIGGFILDTTVKSRPPGQDQGEMELYIPRLESKKVDYTQIRNQGDTFIDLSGSYRSSVRYTEELNFGYSEPSIYILPHDHATWLHNYRTDALSQMSEAALGLIAQALPTRKRFDFAYNIAELRELPALLRESLRFFRDVFTHLGDIKSLSDAYLAYKFGWESTYSAICDMLRLPEKINKEINFLIERAGRPTTFHSKTKFSGPLSGMPAMSYDLIYLFDEYYGSTDSQESYHSGEIKLALNANFPVPKVELPSVIHAELYIRKMGILPTPATVYNIVPWTWLIEWFTGVGEYLKIIETICFDPSLINYGLITFKSKGESKYTFNGHATDYYSTTTYPPFHSGYEVVDQNSPRSGKHSFRYQIRKDLGSVIDGVEMTSKPETLSAYKASIITALAGKYHKGKY